MEAIMYYVISGLAIILVMSVMGFTKAYTSYKLGDIAIKNMGKVTLNPKAHFEIIGFIIFLFFNYGWNAPIETSSLYYKNRKKGNIMVCIMPFIVGIIMAFLSLACYFVVISFLGQSGYIKYIALFFNNLSVYFINFVVFNLIPIYPLYGQKLFQTLLPTNKVLMFSQYEKILQVLIIFLLLSGILQNLLNAISSFIFSIIAIPFGVI